MSKTVEAKIVSDARRTPRAAQPEGVWDTIKWVLKPIASLKLTVVLFALCMLVVFFGTLAQVDSGIQNVVPKYFRSMRVNWIPFYIFKTFIPGNFAIAERLKYLGPWLSNVFLHRSFPFPGGWMLGTALLVNLLAAHVVRFKFDISKLGIWLIHIGIMLLLLGELVTGLFQVEGRMDILVGSSSNFVYIPDAIELAFVLPAENGSERVVSIPGHLLKPGKKISHPSLPVDVVVDRYYPNSQLVNPGPGHREPQTRTQYAVAQPVARPEVPGTDPEQPIDTPSAIVTLKQKRSDEVVKTFPVSVVLSQVVPPLPQNFEFSGRKYDVYLRFKREYKPYTLSLLEFKHEDYETINVPKHFSSLVRLEDPSRQENRELKIWMNHPLRHAGESFYQSGFRPDDSGTVLQVVRNPGWLLPYISCALVAGGMLIHFGLTLVRFLRRSLAL